MARTHVSVRRTGVAGWPVVTVMNRPVVAIPVDASLVDALRTMYLNGLRHLAVVDLEGRCVGVLCDRVLAGAWAAQPTRLDAIRVADAINADTAILSWTGTVADVARGMRQHGIDAIVVVDDDHAPVGMITAGDLVALLAKPAR